MKKAFTILILLSSIMYCFSQTPEKMSYQAVVRNASGTLITNQSIGLRITILHGSPSGAVVYQETYNPNPHTNANGLVAVEIGGGLPIVGTFSFIDWASGIYFLKTETDPTGGTNYTLSSTSQLLSVPYAMHAKTADNGFSGNYNDLTNKPILYDGSWANITDKPNTLAGYGITDALSTSHPANLITSTLINNWNTAYNWGNHTGLYRPISYIPAWSEITSKPSFATVATSGSYADLTNKPTTDGSETKVTSGTEIEVTGTGIASNPYVINSKKAHYIGEFYGGGIVFYVYDNGQHGLIAATSDQTTMGIQWHNGNNITTNAVRNGINAGKFNTERIILVQGKGSYPAHLCANYYGGNYGDWYLPSSYELNLLFLQKDLTGGFADDGYWSSNEDGFKYYPTYAEGVDFRTGVLFVLPKDDSYRVRAIRAF